MGFDNADMWPSVKRKFERQAARVNIVRKMIECGIKVGAEDKLYVGDVEVDYSALARAVEVDRRVVRETVKQIRGDLYLNGIFSDIAPFGSSLVDVVSKLGYSAIVIESNPRKAGVIASVAEVLARHDMVIRQMLADDPDMVPDARMTVIIEGSVAEAIEELNELKTVKSIKILK
jgi:uncharacterized protein